MKSTRIVLAQSRSGSSLEKHSLPTMICIAFLFSIGTAFALMVSTAQAAQAQNIQVIHDFTAGADGATPYAGVTIDASGTLYGTAAMGGTYLGGVVFRAMKGSAQWSFDPIYEFGFGGSGDAFHPYGGVVISNGALYGTTWYGGTARAGTVFELTPPGQACAAVVCNGSESVLYSFSGGSDGGLPNGNLTFRQGNIYGTATAGGTAGGGVAFELTQSRGRWTESVLHSFGSGNDGAQPNGGLVFDSAGNLYGTTAYGGGGCHGGGDCGTLYQLVPSSGDWTENILVHFNGLNGVYGDTPLGQLIIEDGNLYGTTPLVFSGLSGTVFELTSNGGWNYSLIYSWDTQCEVKAGVTLDAHGNLYGECLLGGANGYGMVFKLTPSNGTWTLTDLYDFTGANDGCYPLGGVVLDRYGNLYGTTTMGGNTQCPNGYGAVWELPAN